MWNCMVTIWRSLFQKKKGKPATKAVPNGQTSRSMSCSNRAISSKLETTTTSRDNQDAKSEAARVMRIRVVVTQSQLSQIMKESNNSASLSSSSAAVKQLLLTSAIKMSSTQNSLSSSTPNNQGGSTNIGKWRPRLKSILEE